MCVCVRVCVCILHVNRVKAMPCEECNAMFVWCVSDGKKEREEIGKV